MAFASRMLQSASVRSFSASLRQQSVLAGRRSAFQAIRQPVQRRLATTTIPGVPGADAQAQTGFAKLWNSPVGPKTVHFWAPVMKVRKPMNLLLVPVWQGRIFARSDVDAVVVAGLYTCITSTDVSSFASGDSF